MKVSWWDRNIKVFKEFGRDLWIIVRKFLYQPNESIPRNICSCNKKSHLCGIKSNNSRTHSALVSLFSLAVWQKLTHNIFIHSLHWHSTVNWRTAMLMEKMTGFDTVVALLVISTKIQLKADLTYHLRSHFGTFPAALHNILLSSMFHTTNLCYCYWLLLLAWDVIHTSRAYATMSVSVCLSVTEVNWRIIANLGFKFRSKFTAHCGRGEVSSQQQHLALC